MPTSSLNKEVGGIIPATVIPYLVLFLVAFGMTFVTVPLAKIIALKLGAVDRPGRRRINKTEVPRMGGLAIFIGIASAFFVQLIGSALGAWPSFLVSSPQLTVNYWLLALAFLVVFLVGFIDDQLSLSPLPKIIGQTLASIIAVASGLVIGAVVNPAANDGSIIQLGWIAYPITVVYLVAYINIINLIDGLDGLATGISALASSTMFVLAILAERVDAAALAITIAGTSLAFLRFNFHPASIFMGDSGSHVLGFSLGCISLLSVTRVAGLTTIILPLVIAGIPIIDTLSAIVRRTRAHVSVSTADRGHIHHRLLDEGFSQRRTVLVMYLWTAILCVGSIIMTQLPLIPRISVFVVLLLGSIAFASHLNLFTPVLFHHYNPKTGEDELVGPSDAAFEEEVEKFEERHEERREAILEALPLHRHEDVETDEN